MFIVYRCFYEKQESIFSQAIGLYVIKYIYIVTPSILYLYRKRVLKGGYSAECLEFITNQFNFEENIVYVYISAYIIISPILSCYILHFQRIIFLFLLVLNQFISPF